MRVAVIGDVGGHLDQLYAELVRLGADPAERLPDDLVVVQVGDLVHRGPDSDGVIDLVDRYLRTQPGRWIQLIGNHESIYLDHAAFNWPDQISTRARRVLRQWWSAGQAVVATAVETGGESFLVTHAGVTAAFWSDHLGAPRQAQEAADRINQLAAAKDHALFRPGFMLTGRTNAHAGPLWADTARELVPGWLDRQMPFSQIHGHATMINWGQSEPSERSPVQAVTSVDATAKHQTVWIGDHRLIGIDPGHCVAPVTSWRALVLDGVVHAPR